ncbi:MULTISPECIES: ATP-binding protein [unclassified Janthinobacterium]|uniref:ATP-binding protein n=1 Tax=unclassified Janthinobacterium TaxID=2610881 RepID=UPI0018C8D9FD|nr:ATP-binding protein [Janthinobacterium sp. CG_23.4]MDH6157412.1 DNA replication protein DnaC [Janthinobacterium sp. CG_23.4]
MAELPNRLAALTVAQSERPASCDIHGDYTAKGFAVGRMTHWMGCPDCSKQAQAEKDQAEAVRSVAEAQRRLESSLNQAGIPERYRRKTFESFIVENDAQERALCVAMEFAGNFDAHRRSGTVIVFSGVPGTGKSHLAIAIAQAVMSGHTALYTSAIDAVRMIRNTWRRDSERTETQVLDMLAGVDLLVLDEVGVQYGTEAEQVNLFDIIDKRYRALMPTILLTNQGKGGLKSFLGDRSFDRLREGGQWVVFDWESYRGRAAA